MSNLIDVMEEQVHGPWGKEPHRVSDGAMLARFLVGQCGMSMTEVPGEFWSVDEEAATLPCPCSATVVLPEGRLIFDENVECERAYIYDGEQVWCINSPKGHMPTVPAEPGVDVPEEPGAEL